MKPYIIDDRDIVTANVKCIIFYTTLFAIMYKGWLEYKGRTITIILGLMVAKLVISSVIASIRHLKRYYRTRHQYLRIDKEGIFMYDGEGIVTVGWEQVKEIDFCRNKENSKTADLCVYIYLGNGGVRVFSLEKYIDGINIYALRRAFRHFSNRPDIVKKRNLIII